MCEGHRVGDGTREGQISLGKMWGGLGSRHSSMREQDGESHRIQTGLGWDGP